MTASLLSLIVLALCGVLISTNLRPIRRMRELEAEIAKGVIRDELEARLAAYEMVSDTATSAGN